MGFDRSEDVAAKRRGGVGWPLARQENQLIGLGPSDKPAAAEWPEQGPSLKSADALARADRPGSGQLE
jgi:hypothetical protein